MADTLNAPPSVDVVAGPGSDTVADDDPHDDPDDAHDGSTAAANLGLIDRLVGAVDTFQQSHRVIALPVAVVKRFGDDEAGNLAALVAYYAFFALFPLLLVFVTTTGFVLKGNPEARQALLDSALSSFPVFGDQLRSDIGTFRGSGVALTVGLLGAFWGGLGAVGAMQNTMNVVWDVPREDRPNFFETRVRSLLFLLVLGSALVGSTILGSWASVLESFGWFGRVLAIIATTVVNVALFVGVFKVLTDVNLSWRQVRPGAVTAGIAFTALQVAGGWYVTRIIKGGSQLYGTFAVVLGLLSWLYLQAQVITFSAELNVVLDRRLWPRSLQSTPEADSENHA